MFLFDDFRVEPANFRVFKADNAIQLEPKTLRLLLFLIENRARLIEKEQILEDVWNGTHVTENALVREIAKLRKTLGDDPKTPKYIQTVHTRGYRFIAEIEVTNPSENFSQANGKDSAREEQSNSDEDPAAIATPRHRGQQTAWAMRLAVAGILVAVAIAVWLVLRAHKAGRTPRPRRCRSPFVRSPLGRDWISTRHFHLTASQSLTVRITPAILRST